MDSALRPREIQDRIRSGQSLEEVARAAGVPVEKVEPFAGPVLAERGHVVGLALSSSVRRRGETSAHRNLRQAVADRLVARGIDPDDVDWDAWRNADRRWTVCARYGSGGEAHEAVFHFDQRGRFSLAGNDDARWLISETSRTSGPQPGGRSPLYDEEDDTDDLALVRAVASPDEAQSQPSGPPRRDLMVVPEPEPEAEDEPALEPASPTTEVPRSAITPVEIREQVEAELDGYGVVPEGRSELDVLYDMLGGISEDSINIYAGLSDPVVEEPVAEQGARSEDEAAVTPAKAARTDDSPPADEQDPPTAEEDEPTNVRIPRLGQKRPRSGDEPAESRRVPKPQPSTGAKQRRGSAATQDGSEQERTEEPRSGSRRTTRPGQKKVQQPDLEQPSLVELNEDENEQTRPVPGARKGRRRRAAVPSWDEIMFGGPTPGQRKDD